MRADIDRIWSLNMGAAQLDASWELRLAGEVLAVRDPDRLFPGASMVKTLIAALIDEDARAGSLNLSRSVQVPRSARVGDDGLLRYGQIPTMHRLADIVLLMIAVSDNTATNTLIGFLGGPAAINARFAARGWSSRVNALIGVGSGPGFSSVSLTDHQAALAAVEHSLIRGAFAAQQDRRSLARLVDPYADFRHKTGTVSGLRHDAGVLDTPRGPLWVGCFTAGGPAAEYVDHPACVAMGTAMRETLVVLGFEQLSAVD